MANRGVFFAITADQARHLLSAKDDEQLKHVIEQIETAWDTEYLAECDKAWDAMHRTLTDGRLERGNGPPPFNRVVLGPRQLHRGDGYIVSLVTVEEVPAVAEALDTVTESWFRRRYSTVVPKDYAPEYGAQDLDYTLEWFQDVRDLYAKAAKAGRAVIFTVDL